MYQPPIVNFPVFSATWSESTNENGATTPAVLAAGGGGAGKTGVGNKISLISVEGGAKHPQHAIASELETSPETCSCVASSGNGQLVAAAFGKMVKIYANNPSGFHELGVVRADHAEKESGINSMVFADSDATPGSAAGSATGAIFLATGGEDGTLRVWSINACGSAQGNGGSPSVDVQLVSECKGHEKPITCVQFHESAYVVLTASKDGSCRLWDWQRSAGIARLGTTSGLPVTVQPERVMCRSCCFSPTEPHTIFSVQSGPRGKSYVTKWKYTIRKKIGGAEDGPEREDKPVLHCSVEPVRVACVSPHPATTMSVRSDGRRLAVGNVEGAVLVYRLPGFVKVMEYPAHDLPVTGLGFASGHAGAILGGYDLLAGSADYKITLFKSQGNRVNLAVKQILAFLWWCISSVFLSVFSVVRAIVSMTFIVVPILGLIWLWMMMFRVNLLIPIVLKAFGGDESDVGVEDADRAPLVV